ncbi:hypothetical protein [Sorangium sp. So ce426]|uniref:hypothetical protein n=1 Tax=Sorangium sp. So ce426 TaxID=3133312 RepID=UPI003F5B90B3
MRFRAENADLGPSPVRVTAALLGMVLRGAETGRARGRRAVAVVLVAGASLTADGIIAATKVVIGKDREPEREQRDRP